MNDWLFFWLRISLLRINPYSNHMPCVLWHTLMWFYRRSGHITHRPILCHERDLVNQLGFARGTFHGKCDDDGDADLEGVDIR